MVMLERSTPRERRSGVRHTPRIIWSVALLLTLAFLLLPSPYAVQQPGPVLNTLGETEIDGVTRPVIDIEGVEPVVSDGALNMLTVRVLGHPDNRLRFFDLIPSLFRPGVEFVRLEQLYPEGQTLEERDAANQALMQNSQVTAAVAALDAMGTPVEGTVTIVDVIEGGPSDAILLPGDEVVAIDGTEVTGSAQVRSLVGSSAPGEELRVSVVRDGRDVDVVITPEWDAAGKRSLIGVTLTADYELPFDVDIGLERTGGPSAGMVFSLAIVETLTQEDLIGDLNVSGTGTVDDDGTVGAVGGVPSKLRAAQDAGSDLFLMPVANCDALPDRLPQDMVIAPVINLSEALDAIASARLGEPVVGLERCNR